MNISKYEQPVDFSADEENSAVTTPSKTHILPTNATRDLTIAKLQIAGRIGLADSFTPEFLGMNDMSLLEMRNAISHHHGAVIP